jgi:hypothetical protein
VFFLCLLSSFRLVCGLGLALARVWLCCVLSSLAVGCMMIIHCLSCTRYTGSLVGVVVLRRPRDCSSGLIVMVSHCVLITSWCCTQYMGSLVGVFSVLRGRVFVRQASLLRFMYVLSFLF